MYAKLGNDNQQFLWGILEEDAKATDRTPIQQKVGDYFSACMDTAAIDAAGAKPVLPKLAEIDALKTRAQLLTALTSFDHTTPGSLLLGCRHHAGRGGLRSDHRGGGCRGAGSA